MVYSSESELFGERQSGDGEEQPEEGEAVDDDEDRKNPAYVPKTGILFASCPSFKLSCARTCVEVKVFVGFRLVLPTRLEE